MATPTLTSIATDLSIIAASVSQAQADLAAYIAAQPAPAPAPAPAPTPAPTPAPSSVGAITVFAGGNNSIIDIGGNNFLVENANNSWCVENPNSNTLRFEVRPGDVWPYDKANGNTAERSEVEMKTRFNAATHFNISYGFTLEAGPANTASWMVLGQIHNNLLGGSPPVAIAMYGEKMVVILRDSSGKENDVYVDPNPIQRGHQYQMQIQAYFGTGSSGSCKVIRDGVTIVNYTGALGSNMSNETYFWKMGVYRAPASMIVAADYSAFQFSTS